MVVIVKFSVSAWKPPVLGWRSTLCWSPVESAHTSRLSFYLLGQWPWMLNRSFSNFFFFWLQYGSVLFFLGKGHYMERIEYLCTTSYICVGGRGPFSCSWLYNTWLGSPCGSRGLTALIPSSLPIPTDVVFNKMRSCLQSRVSWGLRRLSLGFEM